MNVRTCISESRRGRVAQVVKTEILDFRRVRYAPEHY
jgi:hypothetical protein